MKNASKRSSIGLSLIELLVVLAIVGILSAIAIFNYRQGIERTKQKRTMADIRTIASAWESRASERGNYNAAGVTLFTWPANPVSEQEMQVLLSPTWIRQLPMKDGWERKLDFALDEGVGAAQRAGVYAIRSRGRDGAIDPQYPISETTEIDCDIVFSNGMFTVRPK